MLRFLTLGPESGNHGFVLRRYLAAHGLRPQVQATVGYVEDFHDAARQVIAGEADFLMQCAVHPAAPEITGRYRNALFVVDAFVSPSQPMALLRSTQPVAHGGAAVRDAVGLQPATEHYVDLSRWPKRVLEPTVFAVGQGLLQGRYAAGIAFEALAHEYPDRLAVVQPIGAVCDAWIVFGPRPVDRGQALVWTSSPAAALFRRSDGPATNHP